MDTMILKVRPNAFTLVELLSVIAIMALLIGILTPVLGRVRSKANQSVCMSNLRQLSLAASLYADSYDSYPPAWRDDNVRWMDLVKPYIGKDSKVYHCAADKIKEPLPWDEEITMSYGMNVFNLSGQKYSFWYGVRQGDVVNPASTIIFADCTPGKYYCGGGAWREPVSSVDYRHSGGFVAAFCDGHAEFQTATEKRFWDAAQ
jgi:prepilin-type N-terminal cleavage/methylation domain-containing protein/prepilin-type processing-associated H-X9-DG protein